MSLLTVTSVVPLTPRMTRMTFTGPGLQEIGTWPDQQLKLLFPRPGGSAHVSDAADVGTWYQAYLAMPEPERPWMRSFTVRSLSEGVLTVDFVLHGDSGPASRWAATARVGDVIGRFGPSRDYARPLGTADLLVFAGDETALPAIGSLLELLPETQRRLVFVEVADPAEEQDVPGVRWVHRSAGEDLVPVVTAAGVPPSAWVWLGGEASSVRALRRHFVGLGVSKKDIEFAGYWRRALTQDDAPTSDDLAEAQERIAALSE
ncbi:siderophore-interacting protein [Lentzea flaviverrucosa]|uniref:NADPH-dependent ferric siderophore reductase, contains FAD-binding and SIP domains n=1 Tax=Lentzea flaviverrucosa TaxID=200379 RepID=A0A1H9XE98_9PSEU|nr:siderophore-interacting protein [Lentzea flaviverrucosa]RDI21583.1 NADPH-dependent ferric siderophore reductase [Lentzea flaviverrucosa]SES43983.1 NADPH-dependent ferric siderophore reductase, contains FAD-binding and SIP domains [Lentzea flaviverrucosa]